MRVRFDTSALNASRIKKIIEQKVMDTMERVSLKTYNYILMNDYPYWSGSYVSSWNISVGSLDTSYNPPPDYGTEGSRGKYSPPNLKYYLNLTSPYESVYISNYSPHAYLVEHEGTKTSDFKPWMIANNAANNTVNSLKFF